MGSRFGDVTSGRIVRGGLARIERGWISSPWARIARGGVDCVAPGSHCASRPRPRAVGAGGRDPEPPPEHPGYPTSPMRPIGAGDRGAHSIYRRVGCPNLLQRPRSSRSAGGETLIFRASSRGRSRRGAPLQQIWTDRRPDQSHAPHASHSSGGFRPVWSSEPGRVARRTVGGPARFPVMALREDRSGGPIGCARGFPHDCAVVTAARSGAERNDPPRAPFSASDGSGPGSTRELG